MSSSIGFIVRRYELVGLGATVVLGTIAVCSRLRLGIFSAVYKELH